MFVTGIQVVPPLEKPKKKEKRLQYHLFLNAQHDPFRVDIYSPHVLIPITFAVFEYLDMELAMEKKIQDI